MKKKILKKSRVVALAFAGVVLAVSVSAFSFKAEEHNGLKYSETGNCGVTSSEIISYLEGYGYSNITLSMYSGCDVLADTDYSYDTVVYCDSESIIGHEDIPTK